MSEMSGETETVTTGATGHFHRWYDMDVQLSELVQSLETLSEESQTLFAFLLNFFGDEIVRVRGREFFSQLEWEKVMGIYKSKRGRRWYDRQPVLQKAFNKLYSLNDDDKAAIARQLYMPGRLIQDYETHCQKHNCPPALDTVYEIVATSFTEGPQAAQERYQNF